MKTLTLWILPWPTGIVSRRLVWTMSKLRSNCHRTTERQRRRPAEHRKRVDSSFSVCWKIFVDLLCREEKEQTKESRRSYHREYCVSDKTSPSVITFISTCRRCRNTKVQLKVDTEKWWIFGGQKRQSGLAAGRRWDGRWDLLSSLAIHIDRYRRHSVSDMSPLGDP